MVNALLSTVNWLGLDLITVWPWPWPCDLWPC